MGPVKNTGRQAPAPALGQKLRDLRTARGLSRRDVAQGVGISPTRYTDFEKGYVHHDPDRPAVPTREVALKLARFFNFPENPILALAGYPLQSLEPPPIPSPLELEAMEVAAVYRALPQPYRELLLGVVRTFEAKVVAHKLSGNSHSGQ